MTWAKIFESLLHSNVELLDDLSVSVSLWIFFVHNFIFNSLILDADFILSLRFLLKQHILGFLKCRRNDWQVFNFHFNICIDLFHHLIKFVDWCSNQNFRFKSFTKFSSVVNELIAMKVLEFSFTWCRSMNRSRSFVFEVNTFLLLPLILNRNAKGIFRYNDWIILKIDSAVSTAQINASGHSIDSLLLKWMIIQIDHFLKFDFFGFIIRNVVLQIWLHHFVKQSFVL